MKIKFNIYAVSIVGAALLCAFVALSTPSNAQVSGGVWIGGPAPVFRGHDYHGWDGKGTANWSDRSNWQDSEDNYSFDNGWDSGTGSIVWRGSVDNKVDLYFHGSQWTADVISGKSLDDQHARFFQPLPFQNETVNLARVEGRGRVFIFQQPDSDNGYTVGVRVVDRAPGRGDYKFALSW